jgi:hypothetical protein
LEVLHQVRQHGHDQADAQDVENDRMGPGFHWTVTLTPVRLSASQTWRPTKPEPPNRSTEVMA